MNYKTFLGLFISIFSINSCGYHLRGLNNSYKLPYKSIYLDCSSIIICDQIKLAISTQKLATITNNNIDADAIIKISNEETSKIPQNFNAAGRIAAYRLTYQVHTKIIEKNKPDNNINFNVYTTNTMNYNDSTILANNINENDIWDNLHQAAISQLIRKLFYYKQ
jgi:LPS-assembly lipoprotein